MMRPLCTRSVGRPAAAPDVLSLAVELFASRTPVSSSFLPTCGLSALPLATRR